MWCRDIIPKLSMVLADVMREFPYRVGCPEDFMRLDTWEAELLVFGLSSESNWKLWLRNRGEVRSEEEITEELNRGGDLLFAAFGVEKTW